MADMGMAGNDYEEEYLWGATFTSANKEFTWSPEESEKDGATEEEDKDDPSVKPGHRLLLKTAVLMPEAKKDDVCILQVESEGYNKTKVITPIVAMRGGADHQLYVDVLVPHKATFKLIQGEGPIHLVGSHIGKAADNKTPVKESTEDKKKSPEKEDKKESPAKTRENSGGKKRKASEDKANSAEKKKKGDN